MLRLLRPLLWITAVLIALTAAAVAVGAAEQVRTFGPAGNGDGRIGPHASGLAVAGDGTIYVADRQQDRVEVFGNDGTPVRAWGGVDDPTALVVDGGRLIVGDDAGVRAFTPEGAPLEDLGGPASPAGLAIDAGGTVWASDADGGRVVGLPSGEIGEGTLVSPAGLAVAPDGTFYVADPGDGTVKRFTAGGAFDGSFAAIDPQDVAVGLDGTIHVAEGEEHRIAGFAADGTRLGAIGADGPLNVPSAVDVDCRGAVYVMDNSNPRGHVFAEPGTPAPPCPPAEEPPAEEPPAEEPPAAEPTVEPPPRETPQPVQAAGNEPPEEPDVGRTARATVLDGVVFVGEGATRRLLTDPTLIPIGEQVDTTAGVVRLEFEAVGADRETYGPLMEAEFEGGAFTIHQSRGDSLVEIALAGADPLLRSGRARAAAKRPRRRVWTRARGRFRTRGNHGAATVRGTQWLTEERPRGTFFQVTEGSIGVQSFSDGSTRVLNAPESFLARPPCMSRRRFRIRLRPPVGTVVRDVAVQLGGRRVPVRRGRRLTAVIDLRGRPRGRVVVRIAVRTADGRVIRGVRDYHTCRKGTRPSGVPRL